MRILLVGGGSGGHVTPLRAISQSIKRQSDKPHDITLITDRKFYPQTKQLFIDDSSVRLKKIYSGKFRRYHGHSFAWHILHLPTLLLNIRDVFLLGVGFMQSFWFFVFHKPDVVFCKGGFTCVPVGLVARLFRVPLFIHDSDTVAGLTNRILARFASKILTGMPVKYYSYNKDILSYVGIPVNKKYTPITTRQKQSAKKRLGIKGDQPVMLITGGGTGARVLNDVISSQAEVILEAGWRIVLITGKGKAESAIKHRETLAKKLQNNWQIEEFTELLPFVEVADIVVSRAGATAMQEFANAKKAVVIVPSPYLTGGHQLKNADMYADKQAAIVFDEIELQKSANSLSEFILKSQDDLASLELMAERLYEEFAKPDASDGIAEQLLYLGQVVACVDS